MVKVSFVATAELGLSNVLRPDANASRARCCVTAGAIIPVLAAINDVSLDYYILGSAFQFENTA